MSLIYFLFLHFVFLLLLLLLLLFSILFFLSSYRESSWSTAVVAGLQLRALSDRERHVNGAGADMCSLGYVMTQALVESGADAAIVDLNCMPYPANSIIIRIHSPQRPRIRSH